MNTALIIGDVQRGITANYPFAAQVVDPLYELLPRAREVGTLVVFVRFALRPNGIDLPRHSELFRTFHEAGDAFHEGAPGTEIELPVAAKDLIVSKRRASAFAGTDLDLILRANGVDTLAIAGVATSAMVAATCYDAADRDYRVIVLRDGCADAEPTMHDFFMDTVFPNRGFEVVTCAEWLPSPTPQRMSREAIQCAEESLTAIVAELRGERITEVVYYLLTTDDEDIYVDEWEYPGWDEPRMGVELITDSGRHYSARTTDAFTEYGMEIFRKPMSEVLRLDLGGIKPVPATVGQYWVDLVDKPIVTADICWDNHPDDGIRYPAAIRLGIDDKAVWITAGTSGPSGTGYNFWLGLDDVMVVFTPQLSEEIGIPEPS
ncbi:cysteine hydrolase family protein [Nocardia pneumoniae]|uniref:cysteine hydrolase family protein n=1 Tax=Nocardia pneumoniae TaxID=228601 RepID=UPI0002DDB4E3|nr:cysteine hydrolase [Nocardia pneumoniae]